MSDNPLSGKVSLETTDFKTGIAEMNRSIKVIESGFKSVAAGMEDWEKTSAGLEARIQALTKEIGLQEKKVSAIAGEYRRVAAEKGATSKAAQDLEIRLNRENETLNKMQLELKQSDTRLKEMGNGLENVGEKAEKASKGFSDAGIKAIELNQIMDAAGRVADLASQAYDLLIVSTMKYEEEVRDLARTTGASIEETSRLYQAADDLKVSYDTLMQAAKALAKDGIALTTEELAKSADEYLAITDAGGRAEYANKKYGKSAQELTKILEIGGDAFRQMAAEQSGNLILTQAQVDKSRELEKAQDALEDSVSGLKVAIGNVLIPVLADAANTLNDIISREDRLRAVMAQHSAEVKKTAITYEDYVREMIRAEQVKRGMIGTQEQVNRTIEAANGDWDLLVKTFGFATRAEYEAAQTTDKMKSSLDGVSTSTNKFKDNLNDLDITERNTVSTQKALAEQIAAVEKSYQTLRSTILSGGTQIYQSTQDWKDKQAELNGKIQETQGKIAALSSLKYLTPAQKTELDEMKTKLGEQKQAIVDAEIAHDKATKTMIYNMLLQKAASDGLTANEFNNLMKVAVSFGLVDQASANMAKHINEIDLDDANAELGGIDSKLSHIMGLPSDKTFTITTFHNEYWNQPPSSPTVAPRASGGPVTAGQPYWVGEKGPEPFIPNQSGVILANKLAKYFESIDWDRLGNGPDSGGRAASGQLAPTTINNINLYSVPEREMDMRKQARLLVEEIQRNQ